MAKLLLLYDTHESDLAKDFKNFLNELGLEVNMIPLAPDKGGTLQGKEKHYFSVTNGAIFLLTPGSERGGKDYPSPSVNHEMGQAMEKYSTSPEKVIYLVDTRCEPPTIDQKSYISFDRKNIRTIIDALTQLVRDLKCAGFLGDKKSERQETPGVNVSEFAKTLEPHLKTVCEALSDAPSGAMKIAEFEMMLKTKFHLKGRYLNLAIQDLRTKNLINHLPPSTTLGFHFYQLSPLGFEVVRHLTNLRSREEFARNVKGKPGKGLLETAAEFLSNTSPGDGLASLGSKPPALGKNALTGGLLGLGPKPPALNMNALKRNLMDQNELARDLSALDPKTPAFEPSARTRGLLDLEDVPSAPGKNALTRGLSDLEPPVPAAIRRNALKEGLAALEPKPRAFDPDILDKLKKK